MQEEKDFIKVYKNVFDRNNPKTYTLDCYLKTPEVIFDDFKLSEDRIFEIKNIKSKEERNNAKRDYLPAIDLSPSNIMILDFDMVNENQDKFNEVISKLSNIDECRLIKESISNNLFAAFKFDKEIISNDAKYNFLYLNYYFELTLQLGTYIDFLPEPNRLRYFTLDKTHYLNENSSLATKMLPLEKIPVIKPKNIFEGENNNKPRKRKVTYRS